ncbi:MAG: hypothetical protein ACREL5_03985 [Gemmatimonadales bacterium]
MSHGHPEVEAMQQAGPIAAGLEGLVHEADLTLRRLLAGCAPGDPLQNGLMEMGKTVRQLVDLAEHLESEKRGNLRTPLDLATVVGEMFRAVQRLLGPFVELRTDSAPGVWAVVERFQAEQIALSLAINAREALPMGGAVSINARRWHLVSAREFRAGTLPPGEWSILEVRDNRLRIDDRLVELVTAPTSVDAINLSLGSAAGIVRAAGGQLVIDTGDGTALAACFPAAPSPRPPPRHRAAGIADAVLIVDDDEWLRLSAARSLRRAGYGVLVADHSDAALELLDDVAGSCVRILVCRGDLRCADGLSLVETIRARRPDVDLVLTGAGVAPFLGVIDLSAGSEALLREVASRLTARS